MTHTRATWQPRCAPADAGRRTGSSPPASRPPASASSASSACAASRTAPRLSRLDARQRRRRRRARRLVHRADRGAARRLRRPAAGRGRAARRLPGQARRGRQAARRPRARSRARGDQCRADAGRAQASAQAGRQAGPKPVAKPAPKPAAQAAVQHQEQLTDGRGRAAFRAMGTDCHVLVHAPVGRRDELADLARRARRAARAVLEPLPPDSELSRLNARAGQGPQPVSADLLLLVTSHAGGLAGLGRPVRPDGAHVHARPRLRRRLRDRCRPSGGRARRRPPGRGARHERRRDRRAGLDHLPARGRRPRPGRHRQGPRRRRRRRRALAVPVRSGVLVNLGGDISVAGEHR